MVKIIRLARRDDAEAIHAIYAPVVTDTPISFEMTPPSREEMVQRIEQTLKSLPWLVYEDAGEVLGYAYAGQHRVRAAYRWSVDVSVYVHERARGRGIGKKLYTALFKLLREQGFYNVYAGVTLPNPASVALHEAMGMKPVGVYQKVGYKFDRWYDVGWWQGELQPHSDNPAEPKSMAEMHLVEWKEFVR